MYVFFEPSESWHTQTCVIFVALPIFKSTNTATTTISPTLAPSSNTVASNTTTHQTSCTTDGGAAGPNKACIFPFIHNNVTYTTCTWTQHHQTDLKAWCSTAVYDEDHPKSGQHRGGEGLWGTCDPNHCDIPPNPHNASTTHQNKTTETTAKTTTTTKTTTTITTPTTTTTTTTTPTTTTTTTSSPVAPSYGKSARTFDGWSFFGGILFAVGLSFLGFVGFKYYKTRITVRQNYNNF